MAVFVQLKPFIGSSSAILQPIDLSIEYVAKTANRKVFVTKYECLQHKATPIVQCRPAKNTCLWL